MDVLVGGLWSAVYAAIGGAVWLGAVRATGSDCSYLVLLVALMAGLGMKRGSKGNADISGGVLAVVAYALATVGTKMTSDYMLFLMDPPVQRMTTLDIQVIASRIAASNATNPGAPGSAGADGASAPQGVNPVWRWPSMTVGERQALVRAYPPSFGEYSCMELSEGMPRGSQKSSSMFFGGVGSILAFRLGRTKKTEQAPTPTEPGAAGPDAA